MKKMSLFAIAALAFVAFAVMPATGFACGEEKSAKTTAASDKSACGSKVDATQASAKSACGSKVDATQASAKSACGSKVEATQASAKANCDPSACATMDKAACAALIAAGKCDPSACASKATTAAATDDTKATMVGSKSACASTASKASAESACSAHKTDAATASADADMAGYTLVKMNVSGMTCGGCEKSVTAALEKIDGVVKVKKVCSGEGVALVYVDQAKMKDNAVLTTAVANKGFGAEVIPAVSKVSDVSMSGKACGASEKASKKTEETKMTAAGTN